MKILDIKRFVSYRFTFMLVPHGGGKPRQIHFNVLVVLLLCLTWCGVTFWGSYLSAQHIDYWRTQVSNQVLKMKVQYLLAQLDNSRSFLDEVKTAEGELRNLLQHRNGTTIIKNESPVIPTQAAAQGGPTLLDQVELANIMGARRQDFSWGKIFSKVSALKNESESRLDSYKELSGWIDDKREHYKAMPRGWPCPGHLSSHFGRRFSPFTGLEEYHAGVDISGPMGTPIRATADGQVRIASWQSGYGNMVLVQHGFGYSTRYAHNSRLLVKVGDRIKRDQVIALMGDTGRASGTHCHYEVWRYSRRQNPYAFLKEDLSGIGILTRRAATDNTSIKKS